MKKLLFVSALVCAVISSCGPKDGVHSLHILTTNDVHGCYFDSTYVGTSLKKSLLAVNYYADSVRSAVGEDNVLLIDAGDFLQGDNAAYYFNYVDTATAHIFPRMARYMGYDVIVAGNHDIETGHPVYDRISAQLRSYGIPFLAGNAIRTDNGKPYFPYYAIVKKAGLKVAVLGFDNANIKAWLDESLWSGMTFQSLLPLVQEDVDKVIRKEHPDVVVVAVHSGTGEGDGSVLESQGLDLLNSLSGVDCLICAHDHSAKVIERDDIIMINSGSHAKNVGHGVLEFTYSKGKLVSKKMSSSLIPVRWEKADPAMRAEFYEDYLAVKSFTLREVGELAAEMRTRDAFKGMCDYMNLIHTISLSCAPAQISFAAPLTYNGTVKAGTLVYNDIFTIYPFENQLFVVKMTGGQIKNYLEASYDQWIQTIASSGQHVFRIEEKEGQRGDKYWSFSGRTYNFDSAAGLVYTVDVTAPYGSRVAISSLVGGAPFDLEAEYNVAMTSYRASGGGELMGKAGIDTDRIDDIVVAKYPEIRNLVYEYILAAGTLSPEVIGDPDVIGQWSFVPENIAGPAVESDFKLLFKD